MSALMPNGSKLLKSVKDSSETKENKTIFRTPSAPASEKSSDYRKYTAFLIAILADLLISIVPNIIEFFSSFFPYVVPYVVPLVVLLVALMDILTGILLLAVMGFSTRFFIFIIPAIIIETIPGISLFPTWILFVCFVFQGTTQKERA